MIFAGVPAWAESVLPDVPDRAPVLVELFFEAGCESCAEIRQTVLPELERRYSGYYQLGERDIGIQSNYLALVHYQEAAGVRDNEPVSIAVDGGVDYLAGVERIKAGVFPALEQAIARHLEGRGRDIRPLAAAQVAESGQQGLQRRLAGFTLVGVMCAAAVDSINPCAIATLVFFMSLLSAARMGARRMMLAGLAFLAACFVTYLGIGFGLLRVLDFLVAFREARRVIEFSLMAVMVWFAFLSFRDAIRYRRTGRAADVTLKLPESIQIRIHRVIKAGMRKRNLVLGGIGVGVAVTLLESVCTGQVYVPALVMMLKSGHSMWLCTLYLLVYNVIFVMPLAVVLVLTCAGMSTPVLVEWSRRNVVTSKLLMGLLFVGMTVLMVLFR